MKCEVAPVALTPDVTRSDSLGVCFSRLGRRRVAWMRELCWSIAFFRLCIAQAGRTRKIYPKAYVLQLCPLPLLHQRSTTVLASSREGSYSGSYLSGFRPSAKPAQHLTSTVFVVQQLATKIRIARKFLLCPPGFCLSLSHLDLSSCPARPPPFFFNSRPASGLVLFVPTNSPVLLHGNDGMPNERGRLGEDGGPDGGPWVSLCGSRCRCLCRCWCR